MKSVISKAASYTNPSETATKSEQDKYRLLVTAGPSYDPATHKIVHVNTSTPTFIENDFLRAKIHVRIRDFRGLPSSSPSVSEYFHHPLHDRDQYSVGFSFVPKQDLPSLHTVWGNDLDHPVRDRLPRGINHAFRIVKTFIDPGLACDFYADEPWLYGPSLSCWLAFRIGAEVTEGADFDAPGVLTEGADGTGAAVRARLGLPDHHERRRRHFLSAPHRERMVFQRGRLYSADFYNPYLDFANYALRLPGFGLKVLKYIGDKTHCLRYVFKDRETGAVYFNVNITLLWGERLERALEDDAEAQAGGAAEGGIPNGGESREGKNVDLDDQEQPRESASDGKATQEIRPGTRNLAPATMQLHPGDHTAAAEYAAAKAEEGPVDEIDRLLRETSTQQQ